MKDTTATPTRAGKRRMSSPSEIVEFMGDKPTPIYDAEGQVVGTRIDFDPRRRERWEVKDRAGWRPATPAEINSVMHVMATTRPRERRDAGGSRRRAGGGSRSSARSGDSGDDGPSDEPPSRRLCAYCGGDIPADRSPLAKHCKDQHADRNRQRRKRERDRARDLRPRIPTTADFRRMLEITEEDIERLRSLVMCRCNGDHIEFERGSCFTCGRWLPAEKASTRRVAL